MADNIIQSRNVAKEVFCDFPHPGENTGPPELINASYEVLNFTFIPDNGNNTSQLKFEIKLNNGNNYPDFKLIGSGSGLGLSVIF